MGKPVVYLSTGRHAGALGAAAAAGALGAITVVSLLSSGSDSPTTGPQPSGRPSGVTLSTPTPAAVPTSAPTTTLEASPQLLKAGMDLRSRLARAKALGPDEFVGKENFDNLALVTQAGTEGHVWANIDKDALPREDVQKILYDYSAKVLKAVNDLPGSEPMKLDALPPFKDFTKKLLNDLKQADADCNRQTMVIAGSFATEQGKVNSLSCFGTIAKKDYEGNFIPQDPKVANVRRSASAATTRS